MIELRGLTKKFGDFMPLDYVVEDSVKCECAIYDNGWGDLVMYDSDLTKDRQGQSTVHFKALINTMDDVEKIKTPVIEHNEEETKERWRVLNKIFDGILKVRLFGRCYINVAPWDDILEWMGMGDAMMRFYEDPDLMHACAKRYIDCTMERFQKYEKMGLLSSNNGYENIMNNHPGYTSELPPPPESGIGCKLKDIWGGCSDQIMTSVSPATSRDVPVDNFVAAARENDAQIIACSALLTTTMGEMRNIVEAVEASELKGKVKVMIGGAPITQAYCDQIGADCYTPDAASAADAALKLCTH